MDETKTIENDKVTPLQSALNSARRAKNKAKAAGDQQVQAIMTHAESMLLRVEMERLGQGDLLKGILSTWST